MSHRELFNYLKKKNKRIDIDGNLINNNTKLATIIYITLLIIYFIIYIINQLCNIPYYPITLYSTNLYSNFIEQILILNKINYNKIYQPILNNPHYYLASKKKTINFNPDLKDFNNNIEISFIALSDTELTNLSDHFNIDINLLIEAQNYILTELPHINAYHIIRENYLDDECYHTSDINHIIKVEMIKPGLYLVICDDKSFYTNVILSDYTYLLQPGEIVTAAYTKNDNQIYFENRYIVDDNYHMSIYYPVIV